MGRVAGRARGRVRSGECWSTRAGAPPTAPPRARAAACLEKFGSRFEWRCREGEEGFGMIWAWIGLTVRVRACVAELAVLRRCAKVCEYRCTRGPVRWKSVRSVRCGAQGEVHRDRLELGQLVPSHRLHVLVEPGVPARKGPDWQRAKCEVRGRATVAGQAGLQRSVALVHTAHTRRVSYREGLRRAVGGVQPLLQPLPHELSALNHLHSMAHHMAHRMAHHITHRMAHHMAHRMRIARHVHGTCMAPG